MGQFHRIREEHLVAHRQEAASKATQRPLVYTTPLAQTSKMVLAVTLVSTARVGPSTSSA